MENIGRFLARSILGAAGLLAVAVSVSVLILRGPNKPETWTVIAASLAVITSVISTWSSRRVLELQEDAQLPNPTPNFDLKSKFGVALFTITNNGRSTAYNISLRWDVDLIDHDGKKIGFLKESNRAGISQLLPSESLSQWIDIHAGFIRRLPEKDYSGQMTFEDARGKKFNRAFRLSAHQYHGTPAHDGEWTKTQYELQKIPKELENIRRLLERRS